MRRRLRFRAWYLAPVFALIALLGWTLASPVGSSPDDDFHLASIWCADGDHTDTCQPGDTWYERRVPVGIAHANCFARDAATTASCQIRYLDREQTPTVNTSRGSFANNYPPIYYATMGLFATPDIELSVLLMRGLNIVLLLGLTIAIGLLLPAARRASLVVPWLITMVPLGVFLIASTNPSSWALIGIGSAWPALLGYYEAETRGRRIALGTLFAVAGLMAAGSRADAAIYLILAIAAVVFLTFQRRRRYLLLSILPAVLVVVGLLFFFTSQQSAVVSTGLGGAGTSTGDVPVDPGATTNTGSLLLKDFVNAPSLWFGVFGTWGLGWLDTGMPGVVPVATIVAFLLIAGRGLTRTSWRKGLVVTGVLAVLWLLPTYILVRGGDQVGENVQPRYLLPLILLMAGLLLLEGRDGAQVTLPRWPVLIAAGGIGVANAVALYFNLRRYIVGSNGDGANLDVDGGWWWHIAISPMTVWVVGSLAFGGMLVVLVREVARHRELV